MRPPGRRRRRDRHVSPSVRWRRLGHESPDHVPRAPPEYRGARARRRPRSRSGQKRCVAARAARCHGATGRSITTPRAQCWAVSGVVRESVIAACLTRSHQGAGRLDPLVGRAAPCRPNLKLATDLASAATWYYHGCLRGHRCDKSWSGHRNDQFAHRVRHVIDR